MTEVETSRSRLVGLALLLVGALAVLSAGRMAVLYGWRGIEVAPADLLLSGLLDWALWLPFVPLVWWLAGRVTLLGPRRVRAGRVLLHLGASLLCSLAQLSVFALVSYAMQEGPGELEQALQSAALIKLHAGVLVYWALVLARHALDAQRSARDAELARARLNEQFVRARLDVLQAHLRPHFLFNTLNAVAALMRRDPDEAETMLVRLGDLLRRSLADRGGRVPLEEELDFLERYIAIEQARLGTGLRSRSMCRSTAVRCACRR